MALLAALAAESAAFADDVAAELAGKVEDGQALPDPAPPLASDPPATEAPSGPAAGPRQEAGPFCQHLPAR